MLTKELAVLAGIRLLGESLALYRAPIDLTPFINLMNPDPIEGLN